MWIIIEMDYHGLDFFFLGYMWVIQGHHGLALLYSASSHNYADIYFLFQFKTSKNSQSN